MIGFGDYSDAEGKGKREIKDDVEISGMFYLENGSTISSDEKQTREKWRKWWVSFCTYYKTLSSSCLWNILVETSNRKVYKSSQPTGENSNMDVV